MTGAVLLEAERRYECPNCPVTDVRRGPGRAREQVMHNCKGTLGLAVPMVRAGTSCKIVAVEREDYIGRDRVQLVDGRPIMSAVTTRDDGQDVTVYAPTATAGTRRST